MHRPSAAAFLAPLALVALILATLPAPAGALAPVPEASPRTLIATGDAIAAVDPDEIVFTFVLDVAGANTADARRALDQSLSLVGKALDRASVPLEGVVADESRLARREGPERDWRLTQSYQLVLKDLKKADDVQEALQSGPARSITRTPRIANPQPVRDRLRADAAKAARAKADTLSAALGVKVVGVLRIIEVDPASRTVAPRDPRDPRADAAAFESVTLPPPEDDTRPAAGKLMLRARIVVTFEIAAP